MAKIYVDIESLFLNPLLQDLSGKVGEGIPLIMIAYDTVLTHSMTQSTNTHGNPKSLCLTSELICFLP